MNRRSLIQLIGWLAVCLLAELAASWATSTTVGGWYQELRKPVWTPPGWIFGPVWTVLYLLMGVAAWLVQTSPARSAVAIVAFLVQLAFNVLWSILFFSLKAPGLALVEILVLWVAILVTLILFGRIRRLAGLLLLPYLAWVTYASALNGAIWWMNR